jgi:hypothetical protein
VLRAYDGVSVRVPEFAGHYEQRVRLIGRNILASETEKNNGLTLRIYDVLQGKNLWKQTFAPGSILLQSEDPRLAGVAEPDGSVRVVDVQTQKEVLSTKLADSAHLARAVSVALVSDPESLYLAINGPADPNLQPWGGVHPNLLANAGLRSVPINGMLYSFSRKTGKINWYNPVLNQQMVLSQFEDLPMVLFTARYTTWVGNPGAAGRGTMQMQTAMAIAKHNGKRWWENDRIPNDTLFHSLEMDHRTGKVELTGYHLKVTMAAVPK